jgi:hypothetical protein
MVASGSRTMIAGSLFGCTAGFQSILQVLTIVRHASVARRICVGSYADYYNRFRTHRSLNKDAPRTTHPRRTAQAWTQRRSINRRDVHGRATWTSQSGVEDLSAKPRSGHCRHGLVRGPDHWLRTAVSRSVQRHSGRASSPPMARNRRVTTRLRAPTCRCIRKPI